MCPSGPEAIEAPGKQETILHLLEYQAPESRPVPASEGRSAQTRRARRSFPEMPPGIARSIIPALVVMNGIIGGRSHAGRVTHAAMLIPQQ
jgi:hypothetical protein